MDPSEQAAGEKEQQNNCAVTTDATMESPAPRQEERKKDTSGPRNCIPATASSSTLLRTGDQHTIVSTNKRQACTAGTDGPALWGEFPVDILLQIAVRGDDATIVRFAAANKTLRRGILGPDFRRRLLAVRTTAGRWLFNPALLCGVSFSIQVRLTRSYAYQSGVIETPRLSPLRINMNADLLLNLNPVVSRDGFLVLQPSHNAEDEYENTCDDLFVCDTLTGHVTHLPPISLVPQHQRRWYPPALLTVDNGTDGRYFELLIANNDMEFQTFSSESGQWSAVRAAPERNRLFLSPHSSHPAVLGRTVYWSCIHRISGSKQIIALDVDAARETTLLLPVIDMVGSLVYDKEYLLVVVGGQLSLIVVGSLEVSMFMLTTTSASALVSWRRQLVIRRPEIQMCAGLDVDSIRAVLPIGGFGERSGTLVLQQKNGDLIRLDLETKKVTTIRAGMRKLMDVFLYEMDFTSLLRAMKPY